MEPMQPNEADELNEQNEEELLERTDNSVRPEDGEQPAQDAEPEYVDEDGDDDGS